MRSVDLQHAWRSRSSKANTAHVRQSCDRHAARTRMQRLRWPSVYVHFPWCLAKCPYCDFVSLRDASARRSTTAATPTRCSRELDARAAPLRGRSDRERSSSAAERRACGSRGARPRARAHSRAVAAPSDVEVTVECNPTSLDESRRARARRRGREPPVDRRAGARRRAAALPRAPPRPERRARARSRPRSRRRCRRVSADLIFGLPGADRPKTPRAQADGARGPRALTHLSATAHHRAGHAVRRARERGRLPLADDGAVAEAFLAIDEALERARLRPLRDLELRAPGEEARHNLGYWRGDDYLGLGCGAFGFVRDGTRRGRALPQPDPSREYVQNASDPTMEREELDAEALLARADHARPARS